MYRLTMHRAMPGRGHDGALRGPGSGGRGRKTGTHRVTGVPPAEVLLFRDAEPRLELVQASRAFSFDGDGEAFRIASEAQRIRLAHLFDPYLAVHSSRIEPLPHQITAVYGEMLPRQPLRFLLADDPGAGKTIMAGLLIKELIIRGDLERCLIIAPGNLVEQWQDELKEKFDLTFDIVSREQIETSVTGNPFVERSRLIMRLDMAARSETLQAKLQAAPDWDLVICDEAHRMAASLFGNEVKYTKRYKLGQLVGGRARHFLLMSATPHNGSDADFELFMGLLDADRFEGRPREGARKVDVSDLMRRLTKEELRKFDGAPLFPERKAYTIQYQLSDLEAQLFLVERDGKIEWPTQRVQSEVIGAQRALAFAEVPHALALTCWLHHDALIAALDREIDGEAERRRCGADARSAARARSRGAGRSADG